MTVSGPPTEPDVPTRSGAAVAQAPRRAPAAALLVGAGIFLSRIAGLARQRAFAHYLGTSPAADAFMAAMRIPNFLQNLFGEGALSASFVPAYARLLGRGEDERARHVAGAVATLLAAVTAVLVLLGMLGTPLLVDLIASGFDGEKRALTIRLVRLLFPGIGLLVVSAWCLGVLNSHRRFFLSYVAPVLWNAAIIIALLWQGRSGGGAERYAFAAAWGAVVGSALQLLIQLPTALALLGGLRPTLSLADEHVREVLRKFAPALLSRGIVQISTFVDSTIASRLPDGAVTALFSAQTLYTLPVSLFGMSVSVAELTAMSRDVGGEGDVAARLRTRLSDGLRRIAFFVVPSAVAFAALGDVLAAALFQSGRFDRGDVEWVWGILAGSAVGLLAATLGRLYASAFFALRDTDTPLRYAVVRIVLQVIVGWLLALHGPGILGLDRRWGAAGITVASGLCAWIEFVLLRRAMTRRIGALPGARADVARLWGAAILAAGAGWAVRPVADGLHPALVAIAVLAPFGVVYLGATMLLGVGEARALVRRFARR